MLTDKELIDKAKTYADGFMSFEAGDYPTEKELQLFKDGFTDGFCQGYGYGYDHANQDRAIRKPTSDKEYAQAVRNAIEGACSAIQNALKQGLRIKGLEDVSLEEYESILNLKIYRQL